MWVWYLGDFYIHVHRSSSRDRFCFLLPLPSCRPCGKQNEDIPLQMFLDYGLVRFPEHQHIVPAKCFMFVPGVSEFLFVQGKKDRFMQEELCF